MDIQENTLKQKPSYECVVRTIIVVYLFIFCAIHIFFERRDQNLKISVLGPNMTIAFMNFTMFKTSETRFSAKWDLTISVPGSLPGSYICLHGDYQASLLYKDITIATSPVKRYKHLRHGWPHLLKISGVVSEEDIRGAIGKSIMDDIKKRSEVRFGSQLFFPNCRLNARGGLMTYTCDEAELRFDSRSHEFTTTMFGNPTCRNDNH